ncbi:uncharacterized protein PV06_05079 [Exophiala oligosperma]|uniref:C2H2-type domain-containing protein n=1 Tax=Exophiala oligosperma TaxID=215243 RepID=A0A0D2C2Q7_9EURO|nr:uncharacterized protein PV06_05079 [Exophiala oligosperma]KIW44037.1 hypothetical protein PV06_05079 [Exophiala oligosperma]
MSYPSIPPYGNYYDPTTQTQSQNKSQSQGMQSTYIRGRQTSERYGSQASYSNDVRQSHYGPTAYDWSEQNQQSFPNSPSQPHTLDESSRRSVNAQRSTHVHRRQSLVHEAQSSLGGTMQGSYRTHSSNQSTQGLNGLAYASGLSDSGSQRRGDRTQQSSLPPDSSYSGATGTDRALSTATQNNVRQHNSSNRPSDYRYQDNSASIPGQSPPMPAAAAALAGAVSRKYPQASASPVSEASSAVRNGVVQNPVSPFYQSNLPQSQRRSSSHVQQSPQLSNSISERDQRQGTSQDQGYQHASTTSQGAGPSASQIQQQQRPQGNSISKLVTQSTEEYSQPQYSTTIEPQNVMPNYIDPAQVFNPYAREHERRRRAAEEAAKRKVEEEATAERKKEEEAAAAENPRLNDEAAKQKQAASVQAKATSSNKKPKRNDRPITNQKISGEGTDESGPTTQSSEPDMAAELKAMMEKMKDFRTKDPVLFQKLWDDMRKPAASVQSPSSSPRLAQAAIPTPRSKTSIPHFTDEQTPAKNQQRTPVPTPAHSNGYKVVVENNLEALPDLGRFPAERRIRASYNVKKGPNAARGARDASKPTSVPHTTPQAKPHAGSQLSGDHVNPIAHAHPSTNAPPAPAPVSAAPSQAISVESPVFTQGLPPRTADGGTIWPEEKRNALAEAAVKALKSVPANEEVGITVADIHAILEKNPSYIDLCEILEGKGFKFHRGQFARQLLSKVPRLNDASQKAPPSPSQALHPFPGQQIEPKMTPPMPNIAPAAPSLQPVPPQIPNPITRPIPPPTSFQPVNQRNSHPMNAVAPPGTVRPLAPQFYQGPRPAEYRPTPPMGAPVRAARSGSSTMMNMTRREFPQGTKEAMARKRDFSEIVDLTALSDHEDYVLSRKQARVASASPEHDPFEEYQKSHMGSIAPPTTTLQPQGPSANWSIATETAPVKFNPNETPQQGPGRNRPLPATVPGPAPASTTKKSYKALAKQINKNEALQKTYYNPKTVARDILIAAGRHPTERPLNAHMAGLLGKLIDIDSDLSTFDWDAIDPGGPDVPQVALIEIPMEPPRYQLGQYVKRHEKTPEPRLSKLGKRDTPAPVEETFPQHFTPNDHSLSHGRLHPESNSPSLAHPSHGQRGSDKDTLKRRRRNSSVISGVRRRSVRSSSIRTEDNTKPVPNMATISTFPSGKKRGRPFGSKNVNSGVAALKSAATPPTQISVSVPSQTSNPKFRCRWKRCGAHLHNFETLRHHVSKVHCPSAAELLENGYVCWWRRCQFLVEDASGLVTASKSFGNEKAWIKHIEEDHLYDVAMKHGDGPSTKHIGKQKSSSFDVSPFLYKPKSIQKARTFSYLDPQTIAQDRARYLSDEQGRSTTPVSSMKSQDDLELDTFTLIKADSDDHEMTAQRSFMRTHRQTAKNSPKALAEETLRAMSARKASIGPGLERAGAILVTEERRKTLIQNQGLAQVVDLDH